MIGVLGAGSWGTALAVHAARRGRPVRLWARHAELAERMRRERANAHYLPEVELPPEIEPTADMGDLLACDLVLLVVPSHGFRDVLREFLRLWPRERPLVLVSATKGIETETLARMSQVAFEEGMAADREVRFAVLSGPTFAAELARGMPTAAVIAAEDGELPRAVRDALAARPCGSTPRPTSSASSSAARPRTSSPSPPAPPRVSGSGTTPWPRSSPAACTRSPAWASPTAASRAPSPASPASATWC